MNIQTIVLQNNQVIKCLKMSLKLLDFVVTGVATEEQTLLELHECSTLPM